MNANRWTECLIAGALLLVDGGLRQISWGQALAPPAVRSFPLASSQEPAGRAAATATSPSAASSALPAAASPASPQRALPSANPLPESAQRFATPQRNFAIPISILSGDQAVVGLNLFVSYNRGQTWERHSQIALAKGAFDFTAQQEGEFWFAVQTVASGGELNPPRVTTPDLIVLVDQQVPTIQASAQDDAAGRIQVTWNATDAHLDSRTLKIRYRALPAGGEQWLEVPGQHPGGEALGPVYRDSLAFWPEGNGTAYELAVTIADSAGNEATARTLCTRTQPKQMTVDARSPLPNVANAAGLLQTTNKPPTPEALARPVEWPSQVDLPSGQHVTENSTQGASPLALPSNPNPLAPNPPTPNSLLPGTMLAPPPSASPPLAAVAPPQLLQTPPATLGNRGENGQPAPFDPGRPATSNVAAPPDHGLTAAATAARNASERKSIMESSPYLETAMPVGTTRFRLNYQVDSLALADFQEIVIWVTRDQGSTWDRLGVTTNPTGPYAVSVDGSGLYGFRLVVSGRNGLKGRIPQPGDSADTWVLVDVDAPQVRLSGAPFGAGENAGKLLIQWQATDLRLELRPIDLEYSTSPEGPWTSIEKNLRNSGSYAWAVDPNFQQRIFLRVSARDTAGNRGSDQTTQAIDLANLFPRGRIQSVEPIR